MTVERDFDGVRSQFAELKTVSERQERNIDRLVGIAEALIKNVARTNQKLFFHLSHEMD